MSIKQRQITKIYISHNKDRDIVYSCWHAYYNVYKLTLVNWYVTHDNVISYGKKYFRKFYSGKIKDGIV